MPSSRTVDMAIVSKWAREVLFRRKPDWSAGYRRQIEISLRLLNHWSGHAVEFGELDADLVSDWLTWLRDSGRSVCTVNDKRGDLFTVWQAAFDMGTTPTEPPRRLVRKLKAPRRRPQAWHQDEMRRLILACRSAPTRRGWGPRQWEALVATVYDSSLRIGALLDSKASQLIIARNQLYVPAELQKGREDTLQPLHQHTVWLLQFERDGDDRLFPWPFARDDIARHFGRDVLKPAGLPCGRRDKFHRIRRTSYTLVYSRFGVEVASLHAAHKMDLSRYYLDTSLLDKPNPLDALPRPA